MGVVTAPYFADEQVTVYLGDCLRVMRTLPDASVDAVITDPPYGLEFMGKEWDRFSPGGKRPGFGKADGSKFRQNMGTPSWGATGNPTCRNCGGDKYRNGDRKCRCDAPDFGNHMATHMQAFQIWCGLWAAECLRVLKPGGHLLAFGGTRTYHRMVCAVEDSGLEVRESLHWIYGGGFPKSQNHLKPAHEPIVLARRPLSGTVAANVLEHGTGALNIAACRTAVTDTINARRNKGSGLGYHGGDAERGSWTGETGRWPTNLLISHLPECGPDDSTPCQPGCAVAELDRQSGVTRSSGGLRGGQIGVNGVFGIYEHNGPRANAGGLGDEGGASRFYPVFRFQAKAPTSERPKVDGVSHETVKPLALMRWLVRLVTPPGGTILDPFLGSGTTAEAALIEGFRCIGIERDERYAPLIRARLDKPIPLALDFDFGGAS